MAQWLALQIEVDERRDEAGFGQAQPNGCVLGAVVQQQRHRVTRLEAGVFEDVSDTVAQFVDLLANEKYMPPPRLSDDFYTKKAYLLKSPFCRFVDQGHFVRMFLDELLKDHRYGQVVALETTYPSQELQVTKQGPSSDTRHTLGNERARQWSFMERGVLEERRRVVLAKNASGHTPQF